MQRDRERERGERGEREGREGRERGNNLANRKKAGLCESHVLFRLDLDLVLALALAVRWFFGFWFLLAYFSCLGYALPFGGCRADSCCRWVYAHVCGCMSPFFRCFSPLSWRRRVRCAVVVYPDPVSAACVNERPKASKRAWIKFGTENRAHGENENIENDLCATEGWSFSQKHQIMLDKFSSFQRRNSENDSDFCQTRQQRASQHLCSFKERGS